MRSPRSPGPNSCRALCSEEAGETIGFTLKSGTGAGRALRNSSLAGAETLTGRSKKKRDRGRVKQDTDHAATRTQALETSTASQRGDRDLHRGIRGEVRGARDAR